MKFIYGRIYDEKNDKEIGEIIFDEVQEFDGDETLTISWTEDGVARLYKKREEKDG